MHITKFSELKRKENNYLSLSQKKHPLETLLRDQAQCPAVGVSVLRDWTPYFYTDVYTISPIGRYLCVKIQTDQSVNTSLIFAGHFIGTGEIFTLQSRLSLAREELDAPKKKNKQTDKHDGGFIFNTPAN